MQHVAAVGSAPTTNEASRQRCFSARLDDAQRFSLHTWFGSLRARRSTLADAECANRSLPEKNATAIVEDVAKVTAAAEWCGTGSDDETSASTAAPQGTDGEACQPCGSADALEAEQRSLKKGMAAKNVQHRAHSAVLEAQVEHLQDLRDGERQAKEEACTLAGDKDREIAILSAALLGLRAQLAVTKAENEQLRVRLNVQADFASSAVRESNALASEIQSIRSEDDRGSEVEELRAELERVWKVGDVARDLQWQFKTDSDHWSAMPVELSSAVQALYENFVKCGLPVVQLTSGVELYEFDFRAMSQRNVRSGAAQSIRCKLQMPEYWERCTNLTAVYEMQGARTVEMKGFDEIGKATFDGCYVESLYQKVNGHPVWWKSDGRYFMYVAGFKGDEQPRLHLVPLSNLYVEIISGTTKKLWSNAHTRGTEPFGPWERFAGPTKLEDASGASQRLKVTATLGPPLAAHFMNVAVELFDPSIKEMFRRCFLDSSSTHQYANQKVLSLCNVFKKGVQVARVMRIENWHLWMKYCDYVRQVRRDLQKYSISAQAPEPVLPSCLRDLAGKHGGLDSGAGECFLYHGTSLETAVKIAHEGFDFRLSKTGGYYGLGTYFASQACKSHQYTQQVTGLRTMLVCRVVVDDIAYADKVDKEVRRPPLHAGTQRCCDSIVAKPGPMAGHANKNQTHQEFVVFDKFQAYPEYIVQYFVCEP